MDNERSMPIFIKLDDYKDLVDVIGLIKAKIGDAKATLGRINQLKSEEDAELEMWKAEIDEVERKSDFIDKTLFQTHI